MGSARFLPGFAAECRCAALFGRGFSTCRRPAAGGGSALPRCDIGASLCSRWTQFPDTPLALPGETRPQSHLT